jgi:hypothetical protein
MGSFAMRLIAAALGIAFFANFAVAEQKTLAQASPSTKRLQGSGANAGRPVRKAPPKPPPPEPDWTAYVGLGLATSASSTYSVSGGTVSSSVSESGSGGIGFNAEIDYRIFDYLQAGFAIDYSPYKYPGGNSDSNLGFFLMPRGQYDGDVVNYWAALGFGLVRTGLGAGAPSAAADSSAVVLTGSGIGLGLSPRVGADFYLSEDYILGVYLAYTTTSGTLSTASTAATMLDESYSRHWITLALRFGVRF